MQDGGLTSHPSWLVAGQSCNGLVLQDGRHNERLNLLLHQLDHALQHTHTSILVRTFLIANTWVGEYLEKLHMPNS